MEKPMLYPDANIFSSMNYTGGSAFLLARRLATLRWWEIERHHYQLVSSIHTVEELADGRYPGQDKAVAAAKRFRRLTYSSTVRMCARLFIENGVVPAKQLGDAAHLAFASVHGVDYLLTWNQSHLANPNNASRLDSVNTAHGWRSPLILTPETIPWRSLGQEIRRLK